ncbi:MAG: hypothetical protein IJ678_00965, partial [Kiritimatiellae bacterium]|nr:hypothetical protein [Kiritimatiellia bacterium]
AAGDAFARRGMTLAGAAAGVASAQVELAREANNIARQQLQELGAVRSGLADLARRGSAAAKWS